MEYCEILFSGHGIDLYSWSHSKFRLVFFTKPEQNQVWENSSVDGICSPTLPFSKMLLRVDNC